MRKTKRYSRKIFLIPILAAVFGLGVFAFFAEAQATTYYVCGTASDCQAGNPAGNWMVGDDSRTSTQAMNRSTPWKTINKCVQNTAIVPGDSCVVGNGIYTAGGAEYVVVTSKGGSSSGGYFTIKSENKWGAKLSGENNAAIGCFNILYNGNYVKVEDFEMYGCKYYGVIANNGPATNIIIKGNKIHDIEIGIPMTTYPIPGQNAGTGIFTGGYVNNIDIDSNIVYSVNHLVSMLPSDPLYYHEYTHGHLVDIRGGTSLVRNNILFDSQQGAALQLGESNAGYLDSYSTIVNNTFIGPHTWILANPSYFGSGSAITFWGSKMKGSYLANNLFYNYGESAVGCGANQYNRYNNITSYNNISTGLIYDAGTSINDDTSCTDQLVATNGDVTGASLSSIKFVNKDSTSLDSRNYSLLAGSTGIDQGISGENIPTYDVNGVTRDANPDIGAYEYVSGPDKYYASPNGTGDGLSEANPFKVVDFWPVAKPGDTLYLLDGIYRGNDSMISPLYSYDNTSKTCISYGGGEKDNPITIKALHDGKVTIDGQGQRKPVYLLCQNYFIIEGINAHDSSGTVFSISNSNNNTIRRSIGWDAFDGNQNVFGVHSGENNLLEDVAGFGIARKIFSSSQFGNHTTIRRAWGSWDGSHEVGPKMTYTMAYNNYDMTCENCIGTWTGYRMKESYALKHEGNGCYTLWNADQCASNGGVLQYSAEYGKDCCVFTNYKVSQPYAVIGIDGFYDQYDKNTRSKVLGSIAYLKTGNNYHVPIGQAYLVTKMNSFEYKDNVAFVEPGSSRKTFLLSTLQGGGGTNLFASNLTGVGGSGSSIHSDWQKSNIQEGPDVASVKNIFTSPDGARLCKRYKDRVLTNEPLWPWPMNQRIIEATTQAGREVVDVTATIEEIFGPIPGECKNGESDYADVNNDGIVNIQDLQSCVNVILEVETNTAIIQRAKAVAPDVQVCNTLDLQAIVNEILK